MDSIVKPDECLVNVLVNRVRDCRQSVEDALRDVSNEAVVQSGGVSVLKQAVENKIRQLGN